MAGLNYTYPLVAPASRNLDHPGFPRPSSSRFS